MAGDADDAPLAAAILAFASSSFFIVAALFAAASSIPLATDGGLGAADEAGACRGEGACAGIAGAPLGFPAAILALKAAIFAWASAFLRSTSLMGGAGEPLLERTRFASPSGSVSSCGRLPVMAAGVWWC